MTQEIEQALISLAPNVNGRPSTELVSLATALLAQSRTRASSLKAEEEVARVYACAHLACERLKLVLMLPKIKPKPPIPPRPYQKLYEYLDVQLPAKNPRKRGRAQASARENSPPMATTEKTTAVTGRRKSTTTKQASAGSPKTASHVQVPAKIQPKIEVRVPVQTSPQVSTQVSPQAPTQRLPLTSVPEWVKEAAEVLCAEVFKTADVKYVLEGVECILTIPAPLLPNHPKAPEHGKDDKLPAVVICISCFVNTRMVGDAIEAKRYPGRRERGVELMNSFRTRYPSWETIDERDVDDWMLEIGSRGWLRFDWLRKIKIGGVSDSDYEVARRRDAIVIKSDDDDDDDDDDETQFDGGGGGDDDDDDVGEPRAKRQRVTTRDTSSGDKRDEDRRDTLQPGLGTMMNDKLDYLSQEKRDEFNQFKARIFAWAHEIAAQRRQRRGVSRQQEEEEFE